jgi:hypothetical protein
MAIAPAAAEALTIERLFSANCRTGPLPGQFENCGLTGNPNLTQAENEGFRTAGGYAPYGVTHFELGTVEGAGGVHFPIGYPEGSVENLRTDIPAGVATNPFAPDLARCTMREFENVKIETPTGPVYEEPKCASNTLIGTNIVHTVVPDAAAPTGFADVQLVGKVYNLEPENGWGATYGVALSLAPVGDPGLVSHSIILGNVEWATDYHDYFEIKNIAKGLISSRLVFYGAQEVENIETGVAAPGVGEITGVHLTGERKFIRNPTTCNPPGPATTTTLTATSYAGETVAKSYQGLVGANDCATLSPFAKAMSFSLIPQLTNSDAPNGITLEAEAKHPPKATEQDISDLKTASVTLPPGMTMNPSAAAGLEGCTPAQIGIGTRNPVTCPSRSRLGTVNLEVPTLPPGSLSGPIYLGQPEHGAITGPPYTVYFNAESARFGVKVRLKGLASPNLETGQLTTTFSENPEAPFNSVALHLNGGAFAPIANPLSCGTTTSRAEFLPFTGSPGAIFEPPFTTEHCAAPQFAAPPLSQSTSLQPGIGGGEGNFTFTVTRPEGQQYLAQMKTKLAPGVVAKIPSVTQCGEAQANAGTCSAASQIGNVQVKAGSGEPFPFNGTVYLTEHYEGAPYGLSIVVPTAAGPFNFGNVVTRAKIEVNPITAQVEVTVFKSFVPHGNGTTTTVSGLPTIVSGIPIRIREITVNVNRPNYILEPTNCSPLTSESTLGSTLGSQATVSSTLQVTGCSSLPFKPSFSASTSSHTSRANGASLSVKITQNPGPEANIRSVVTTLPVQLPSRLSTLNRACLLATFNANPASCPAASKVGSASVVTPTLPNKMTGTAYIVSRGAEFPDLELVLEGDGVKIILDGQTHITKGITTTTFASNPDVPINSFSLNLPMASNSLLAANGSFCRVPLYMPTTITGQNGKKFTQKTKISVSGCLPITQHRPRGLHAIVSVRIPQGGRVRFSGYDLGIITRFPRHAQTVTVSLPVTPSGKFQLRRHRVLNSQIRVGFIPRLRGGAAFTSYARVTFRR